MTALYLQHGELFTDCTEFDVKCTYTIGWVNFRLFKMLCICMKFAVPLGKIGEMQNFFNFCSKTMVGNLLISFLSKLLVFCEPKSKLV